MTEITEEMTRPDGNGQIHAKRSAPRGMMPSTWLSRHVRVTYVDCHGGGCETTGVLLDWCSLGPVLNLSGEKSCLAWETVRSVTLLND